MSAVASKPGSRAAAKARRRAELIEATIECIARHGLAATTLSRVAKLAGLSHGIVNFHFRSKDRLLVAALELLSEEYSRQWRRALERAGPGAADRLAAVVDVDLDPALCNRKKISVWFAFYGEAKARPTYSRLCQAADRVQLETMRELCEALILDGPYPHLDAKAVATGLTAMSDGLWLDCLLNPREFDRTAAKQAMTSYLGSLFPRHFPR